MGGESKRAHPLLSCQSGRFATLPVVHPSSIGRSLRDRSTSLLLCLKRLFSSPMKPFLPSLALFAIAVSALGQTSILLWLDGAPGALGTEDKDKPSLTPYLPEP